MDRKTLAALGEEAAARFLTQERGMQLLARNYRCPAGEIDLIARAPGCLVFVEVKTRQTDRCGGPAEAVTPAKQARLRRAAGWYLARRQAPPGPEPACRFDVVCITGRPGEFRIEHLADAF